MQRFATEARLDDSMLKAEALYMLMVMYLIVIETYLNNIFRKLIKSDQNWANHDVAYKCWDMVMNQWSSLVLF